MATKRAVEIFSAGCKVCKEVIQRVNNIACKSCNVTVLDMHDETVANRAKLLEIRSIPAVLVDGKIADCCSNKGILEESLISAGIGSPV